MRTNFALPLFRIYFVFVLVLLATNIFAQSKNADSLKVKYPFKDNAVTPVFGQKGLYLRNPENLKRSVEYDPVTKKYIIRETIGGRPFRAPQYLTFSEYQKLEQQRIQKDYWNNLVVTGTPSQEAGFLPSVTVKSKSFEKIFGGNTINIQPRGTADLTFSGRINKNENPLFNERQRVQGNFDFDQRIQMNLVGNIGEKLKITTNYNTEAQFDFENQVKLEYTGKKDEIVQKFEAGMVSFPLNTTLISGSQALFGVKTQLQFGRLGVTALYSQQKSQAKEITITNGSQQNEFRLTTDNYEANKHYFLAQYFRNNYNRAMANLPIVTSNVNITKIEVWITNRSNSTTDSRDVLAFMDLGENNPYNNTATGGLFTGGGSAFPAAFNGPGFTQQSNNLLQAIPPGSRFTNNNDIQGYFAATGRTDNYNKLTYARKLTEREFTLNPLLGYISLNNALNADEILAVSYRYTVNGVEYQVGEFSTDVPVAPDNPQVLYAKLLKNETIKTNLPIWDLMMKNIYSLGAYQVSRDDFRLNIFRLDESGVEKPLFTEPGTPISSKLWLQITGVDRLNQQNAAQPDGYFDFLEGQTIDPVNGRIVFPFIEPFGADLAAQFNGDQALIDKYAFLPLYRTTKALAQQLSPGLNRYIIRGTYQSQVSSEFQLNAINVPEGSVTVTAGTLRLSEGADYTVDYNIGRVKILNDALLNSGQPIKIKLESNELFGIQQRSLFGTRLDYRASDNLNLGATIMNLKETPLTQKVNFGEESISNTMYGFDLNYNTPSRFLTRLVDKIPFISTKEESSITFSGEFAKFNPGHPKALDFAGDKGGASYIDDFEGSRSVIDLKSPVSWQISGTPQLFPESQLSNDLSYGFNRAKISFFNIDPIFYNRSSFTPSNIANNKAELSNHYVREVLETEVFPFKQIATGTLLTLPTFNVAYYPTLRGPYNFATTGINPDGTLQNPRSRWGGLFRRIETNDFEALNIEFIEFWVMDPFIYKPNSVGGDLYLNIGNISEDILKDGRKSLENSLPTDGDPSKTDETVWGRVSKLQPVIQAFDNDPNARALQDVGLDGLGNQGEQQKYQTIVNQVTAQLTPQAAGFYNADPSSDDYEYYRGPQLDQINAGILRRYENFNGTDGNSKTSQQSQDALGIENSASTALPDGEDINRDNNSTQTDEYYQYRVSMRPQDLIVGQNNITDMVSANVKLADGTTQTVKWYQFKVPVSQGEAVGGIQDFKSIRFMRMFMTDFADTTVLRFARLQLVRGEWRRYNAENTPAKVLADEALGTPGLDNSTLDVTTVNIEENGTRTPIPYVIPPGIQRERDFSNFRGDTRQNEQSLSVVVKNLRDGYARAAFKTTVNDVRSYKRLQMFIHAEADPSSTLNDGDVTAFIRLGTDNQDNYYEYEIPMKVTLPGTRDENQIWPAQNKLDVEFRLFQQAKTARNLAIERGQLAGYNIPFVYMDGDNKITIKGQPDLSKLRVIMLGARNPLAGNGRPDDGLDKNVELWFNELRLTDFDERGGWAATARMNAKLADFGDVTVSANKSTIGFASLEKRVSEINRSDDMFFDLSSSFELGKFFPDRAGIKIPMYFNYSSQLSTPQYDPRNPDLELKNILSGLPRSTRDSIKNYAQDYTVRRGINFTNVRKIKTNPEAKNRIWDIENLSLSYAYTEYDHRDFINQNSLQKNYRGALAYNYSNTANFTSPFAKVIKNKNLNLLKDFNFNLLPSVLNFRIEVNRLYSENTLRDNDPNNFIPINTTFNKNFQISRLYGISWDLSKSLKLDFNATNLSVVDEPEGRITGLKRDTVWNNLKKLGRTTDYNHTISLSYTVPINKIPYLDFVNLVTRYQTQFNWMTEPLISINNPDFNFGNTIQNSRTIQINPTLNMNTLYNKFGFYRTLNSANNEGGIGSVLAKFLFSIKNVSGSYIRNDGTFLPGYLPETDAFGMDFSADAPGVGFILGSQEDIRGRALANGWLTRDTLMNQLYVQTLNEKLNLRGTLEPFRDFRIELTAFKNQSRNFSTNFKFDPDQNDFSSLSPVTTGDYSISIISLGSAFREKNSDKYSSIFQQFLANREVVSRRLGRQNPNSNGTTPAGYADGYGKTSQDVQIAALMAAYLNKDANSVNLNSFPKIPIPNWRLTYNGLAKLDFMSSMFTSFDLTHGYNSTYNINGFNSLIRYDEANGASSVRDGKEDGGDFLPFYQFSQVTLFEQFVPLLGIDMRLKNNMTINFEYRKSRALSFGLANSQLAQQKDQAFVFGFGYRTADFRFPFGLFKSVNLKNDLNFKVDIALRDNKTVIYRADVEDPEISAGSKNITFRPSIDYVLNQRFNLRIFYDSNITRPYTSQTFNTAFSNFGINLRFTIQ